MLRTVTFLQLLYSLTGEKSTWHYLKLIRKQSVKHSNEQTAYRLQSHEASIAQIPQCRVKYKTIIMSKPQSARMSHDMSYIMIKLMPGIIGDWTTGVCKSLGICWIYITVIYNCIQSMKKWLRFSLLICFIEKFQNISKNQIICSIEVRHQ